MPVVFLECGEVDRLAIRRDRHPVAAALVGAVPEEPVREQIQAEQMDNEERRLHLQDQQTMRQILQDPDVQGPNGPHELHTIPIMRRRRAKSRPGGQAYGPDRRS